MRPAASAEPVALRPPTRCWAAALALGLGTPVLALVLGAYAIWGPPPVLTTLARMGASLLLAPGLPFAGLLGPGVLPLAGLFWGCLPVLHWKLTSRRGA